jgi:hypothetical protein
VVEEEEENTTTRTTLTTTTTTTTSSSSRTTTTTTSTSTTSSTTASRHVTPSLPPPLPPSLCRSENKIKLGPATRHVTESYQKQRMTLHGDCAVLDQHSQHAQARPVPSRTVPQERNKKRKIHEHRQSMAQATAKRNREAAASAAAGGAGTVGFRSQMLEWHTDQNAERDRMINQLRDRNAATPE